MLLSDDRDRVKVRTVGMGHGFGEYRYAKTPDREPGDDIGRAGLERHVCLESMRGTRLVERCAYARTTCQTQERSLVQSRDGDRARGSERIVLSYRRHEPLIRDGLRSESSGHGGGQASEREVQSSGQNSLDEAIRRVLGQRDHDTRMGDMESRQLIEPSGNGARGRHPDRNMPADKARELIGSLPSSGDGRKCRPGIRKNRGASSGHPDDPLGTIEERLTEFAFESADLSADPGLTHANAFSGTCEVGLLDHGNEVLELTDLHMQRF